VLERWASGTTWRRRRSSHKTRRTWRSSAPRTASRRPSIGRDPNGPNGSSGGSASTQFDLHRRGIGASSRGARPSIALTAPPAPAQSDSFGNNLRNKTTVRRPGYADRVRQAVEDETIEQRSRRSLDIIDRGGGLEGRRNRSKQGSPNPTQRSRRPTPGGDDARRRRTRDTSEREFSVIAGTASLGSRRSNTPPNAVEHNPERRRR